jgi:hypothetical protein
MIRFRRPTREDLRGPRVPCYTRWASLVRDIIALRRVGSKSGQRRDSLRNRRELMCLTGIGSTAGTQLKTSAYERSVSKVFQCLLDLVGRVHDKRPVARDRFTQRLARDQQESNCLIRGAHLDSVSVAKEDQSGMGNHAPIRVTLRPENTSALKYVGQGSVSPRDR